MIRLFFLLVLIVAGGYFAGVRIHPEVIPAYFEKEEKARDYWKLYFREGDFIVGELEEETSQAVILRVGGGSVTFPKSNIIKAEKVESHELKTGSHDFWLKKAKNKPLITRRYEDTLIPMVKEKVVPKLVEMLAGLVNQVKDRVESSAYDEIQREMRSSPAALAGGRSSSRLRSAREETGSGDGMSSPGLEQELAQKLSQVQDLMGQ